MTLNNFDTTLYYLFSTFSQTLAGGIALIGAFVLYKFQTINNELEYNTNKKIIYMTDMKNPFKMEKYDIDNKIFYRLLELKDYPGIINKCKNILKQKYSEEDKKHRYFISLKNCIISMEKILLLKKEITNLLYVSIRLSLFTIIVSNLMIFSTPFFIKSEFQFSSCKNYIIIGLIIIVVLLFIVSLYTYMKIIFKAMKDEILTIEY